MLSVLGRRRSPPITGKEHCPAYSSHPPPRLRAMITVSVCLLLGPIGLEAAQGRPAHASYRKINSEYQKLFRLADANQDGRLSLSEARARMPRLLKEFSALDADGDGTLNRSEYATYVHSRYRPMGAKAT